MWDYNDEMKNDFVVIDITINGLDENSKIVSVTALRFENGVHADRFFEYVNSGAVLSDDPSDSSDNAGIFLFDRAFAGVLFRFLPLYNLLFLL